MSEQVYLKCVVGETDESASYRQGNLYEVLGVDSEGNYRVETENGNKFYVPLDGGIWKFELVEGSDDNPKVCPRSLGCFQEVADVIGEKAAEVELQKVIDSEDTIWESDGREGLISCFVWVSSPQGHDFWEYIDDEQIPVNLQTNHHQISTSGGNGSDESKPKSTPVFGDVLHINGNPVVFWRMEGVAYVVVREDYPNPIHVDGLTEFDEYKPDETQELRNRILERWQGKCLENAYDTLVCRVDMSVSDLVEFVVENLNAEFGD